MSPVGTQSLLPRSKHAPAIRGRGGAVVAECDRLRDLHLVADARRELDEPTLEKRRSNLVPLWARPSPSASLRLALAIKYQEPCYYGFSYILSSGQ